MITRFLPTGRPARLLAALALLGGCGLGQAASLTVNPVILKLGGNHRIGALKLNNQGDQPVVMQAGARAWRVVEGADHYSPTDALIVTPPVFTIEPGKAQVVRVGLRQPNTGHKEQAFRVFLEQAPAVPADSSRPSKKPVGVQVTLRLGIPVFIAQPGDADHDIVWRAKRTRRGKLRITAANHGNVHVKLHRLALASADGHTLFDKNILTYLLPGSVRHWTLTPPRRTKKPYRITAWTEGSALQAEIKPSGR